MTKLKKIDNEINNDGEMYVEADFEEVPMECYCPRCDKDTLMVGEVGYCIKCGLVFDEGMEQEEWVERCRNYRELIKSLVSGIQKTTCIIRDIRAVRYKDEGLMKELFKIPVAQGVSQSIFLKEIHDYVEKTPSDADAAGRALKEIAEMLSEED